jgi:cyclophilin family peptidyl-prolyl cis-trans isomerase/protein-disulfide isomerase
MHLTPFHTQSTWSKLATRIISFLMLASITLAACAPTSPASPNAVSPIAPASPAPTQFTLGSCSDARQPTPSAKEISLFPPVGKDEHIIGSADAYVTVLVYSDFQCAACARLATLLKSLVGKYPVDLRVVFRHFPLETLHDKAALAAQAAEAASLQGKFWEMHDLLFAKQADWQNQKPAEFQKWVVDQSQGLGLNKAQFASDLASAPIVSKIKKTWDDGQQIKLPGTPVILVNGEIMKWQVNLLEQLEGFILLARLPEKQFSSCPPVVISLQKQYTARLKTSRGDVVIKLFPDIAPNTVNNFIFLAQKGWYDNNPFHRVISGFIVQTGDPTGTGLGSPGYFIPSEKNTSLVYDRAGMVGMANSGPDTNGSQFFITLEPAARLNNDYPIFGEVVSGMEVLAQLKPHNPSDTAIATQPDLLISVSIEEK